MAMYTRGPYKQYYEKGGDVPRSTKYDHKRRRKHEHDRDSSPCDKEVNYSYFEITMIKNHTKQSKESIVFCNNSIFNHFS